MPDRYASLRDTLKHELSKFDVPDCPGHILHVYRYVRDAYLGKTPNPPCIEKPQRVAILELLCSLEEGKTQQTMLTALGQLFGDGTGYA